MLISDINHLLILRICGAVANCKENAVIELVIRSDLAFYQALRLFAPDDFTGSFVLPVSKRSILPAHPLQPGPDVYHREYNIGRTKKLESLQNKVNNLKRDLRTLHKNAAASDPDTEEEEEVRQKIQEKNAARVILQAEHDAQVETLKNQIHDAQGLLDQVRTKAPQPPRTVSPELPSAPIAPGPIPSAAYRYVPDNEMEGFYDAVAPTLNAQLANFITDDIKRERMQTALHDFLTDHKEMGHILSGRNTWHGSDDSEADGEVFRNNRFRLTQYSDQDELSIQDEISDFDESSDEPAKPNPLYRTPTKKAAPKKRALGSDNENPVAGPSKPSKQRKVPAKAKVYKSREYIDSDMDRDSDADIMPASNQAAQRLQELARRRAKKGKGRMMDDDVVDDDEDSE